MEITLGIVLFLFLKNIFFAVLFGFILRLLGITGFFASTLIITIVEVAIISFLL